MKNRNYRWKAAILLVITLILGLSMTVMAEGASNDNSLADLGILTEGAEVSPEFEYGRTEYDVTVPSGTQKLELEPVPSNENAWIVDITGTELVDGEATVEIIVSAESGEQYPYYLHVKASGEAGAASGGQAETEAEPQTEAQTETEPETEDPRYVKVDRNSLEEAENTIAALKTETETYRDRVGILMKILYGMIAFCVVLLFVVINLILKKKDLKNELNDYRGYGYPPEAPAAYPDGQGYDDPAQYGQGYESQAQYGQGYENQPQYGQTPEAEFDTKAPAKKSAPVKDDPTTVPKPAKAKKKVKKLPEYEQPTEQYTYQQPTDGAKRDKNVEVTMIDL